MKFPKILQLSSIITEIKIKLLSLLIYVYLEKKPLNEC